MMMMMMMMVMMMMMMMTMGRNQVKMWDRMFRMIERRREGVWRSIIMWRK